MAIKLIISYSREGLDFIDVITKAMTSDLSPNFCNNIKQIEVGILAYKLRWVTEINVPRTEKCYKSFELNYDKK